MKKTLLILIGILLISLVNAEIEITPKNINIESRVGVQNNYQMTIKNNYTFDISDFTFSNLTEEGFFFPEISIPANSIKTIDFIVKTTNSSHKQINSKVIFKFEVSIPQEITTYRINITEFGFNPNYIIIHQGDTIIWNNLDDVEHTISWTGSQNYVISPSGTSQYTFNNVETINFQDINWNEYQFFLGTIEVLNKTTSQKAHNPNYDIYWNVNLNSLLNPTNLEVFLLDNIFEIQANKQTEGMVKLKNNGSEIADIIHLSSDSSWITFKENDFNLNQLETKYINYKISPSIFSTNQTNKTYEVNLKIKASNTDEYSDKINVYVPYTEIFDNFNTDEGAMIWFAEVFCKKYPQLLMCNNTIQSDTNTGNGTIIEKEFPINITGSTIYQIQRDISKLMYGKSVTDNQLKELADKLGVTVPQLLNMLNNSMSLQVTTQKKSQQNWDITWIIAFFVLLIVSIIIIFSFIKKYLYRKYLIDSSFQYSK